MTLHKKIHFRAFPLIQPSDLLTGPSNIYSALLVNQPTHPTHLTLIATYYFNEKVSF